MQLKKHLLSVMLVNVLVLSGCQEDSSSSSPQPAAPSNKLDEQTTLQMPESIISHHGGISEAHITNQAASNFFANDASNDPCPDMTITSVEKNIQVSGGQATLDLAPSFATEHQKCWQADQGATLTCNQTCSQLFEIQGTKGAHVTGNIQVTAERSDGSTTQVAIPVDEHVVQTQAYQHPAQLQVTGNTTTANDAKHQTHPAFFSPYHNLTLRLTNTSDVVANDVVVSFKQLKAELAKKGQTFSKLFKKPITDHKNTVIDPDQVKIETLAPGTSVTIELPNHFDPEGHQALVDQLVDLFSNNPTRHSVVISAANVPNQSPEIWANQDPYFITTAKGQPLIGPNQQHLAFRFSDADHDQQNSQTLRVYNFDSEMYPAGFMQAANRVNIKQLAHWPTLTASLNLLPKIAFNHSQKIQVTRNKNQSTTFKQPEQKTTSMSIQLGSERVMGVPTFRYKTNIGIDLDYLPTPNIANCNVDSWDVATLTVEARCGAGRLNETSYHFDSMKAYQQCYDHLVGHLRGTFEPPVIQCGF